MISALGELPQLGKVMICMAIDIEWICQFTEKPWNGGAGKGKGKSPKNNRDLISLGLLFEFMTLYSQIELRVAWVNLSSNSTIYRKSDARDMLSTFRE